MEEINDDHKTDEENIDDHGTDEKNIEDYEMDEEIDINLTFPLFIDPDDYRGITLDDAINGKLHLPSTE